MINDNNGKANICFEIGALAYNSVSGTESLTD